MPLFWDMILGMAVNPSPLVGYNTNVRHKGNLYHIQTEDSGVKRPHVITQLFADGGRIIASEKTSYEEHVTADNLPALVKKLMQDQHKRVFIALRDGVYDEDDVEEVDENEVTHVSGSAVTTEILEHAAARLIAGSPSYERVRPPSGASRRVSQAPSVPFGHEVLTEKTLDEVILAYLAQDLETGT